MPPLTQFKCRPALSFFSLLFIFSLLTTTLHADMFSINKQTDSIALILQEKLPSLAVDKLFSAERGDTWWKYSFYINYDKTWTETVEIVVKRNPKNNMTSDIAVNVIRRDGGLISTKKTIKQPATSEWTAKIQALIQDSQPATTPIP